ncbi:MAG: cell division protein FtsQ/DivIB [Pseudomonadales bacterium]|nr:cell division protein FtsQ/DivIB [Pseudomonadales bacterium]
MAATKVNSSVNAESPERASLFPMVLSLLLLVGGAVLSLSLFDLVMEKFDKPITRVVVKGDLLYLKKDDIVSTVEIYETDTFLKLDLHKVRAGLEANSWIYKAAIGRRWPGTIIIDIREQQPIAVWNESNYLNAYGEVFNGHDIAVPDLPRLNGSQGSEEKIVAHYQSFARQASLIGLKVDSVSYDAKGNWSVTMNNGVDVVLGKEDVINRMARFTALYGTALAGRQNDVARVDMRYDGGAAVSWITTQSESNS